MSDIWVIPIIITTYGHIKIKGSKEEAIEQLKNTPKSTIRKKFAKFNFSFTNIGYDSARRINNEKNDDITDHFDGVFRHQQKDDESRRERETDMDSPSDEQDMVEQDDSGNSEEGQSMGEIQPT